MINWLHKISESDIERINRNILRLEELKHSVHELGYFVFASQGGGYVSLKTILEDKLVRGRPRIWDKLNEAVIGENNQKLALDAPSKFQTIMVEAESLILHEINREKKNLREEMKKSSE